MYMYIYIHLHILHLHSQLPPSTLFSGNAGYMVVFTVAPPFAAIPLHSVHRQRRLRPLRRRAHHTRAGWCAGRLRAHTGLTRIDSYTSIHRRCKDHMGHEHTRTGN